MRKIEGTLGTFVAAQMLILVESAKGAGFTVSLAFPQTSLLAYNFVLEGEEKIVEMIWKSTEKLAERNSKRF